MNNHSSPFKTIAIDILMLVIFLILISFCVWLVWMYFFRGPIELETRGYVSKTLQDMTIQPSEREKYTLQHFHNLDEAVLKGIDYPSTCVPCHGNYAHNKTVKVRAFFNAHSWFISCETCHRQRVEDENIVYRWYDNDTDIPLYKLQGEPGIYGARITPLLLNNGGEQIVTDLIPQATIDKYIKQKQDYSEEQDKIAINEMHKVLSPKPISCDNCHSENSMLDFKALLYSENLSSHLKTIDVGTMISGYQSFHFPDILRPRPDR